MEGRESSRWRWQQAAASLTHANATFTNALTHTHASSSSHTSHHACIVCDLLPRPRRTHADDAERCACAGQRTGIQWALRDLVMSTAVGSRSRPPMRCSPFHLIRLLCRPIIATACAAASDGPPTLTVRACRMHCPARGGQNTDCAGIQPPPLIMHSTTH